VTDASAQDYPTLAKQRTLRVPTRVVAEARLDAEAEADVAAGRLVPNERVRETISGRLQSHRRLNVTAHLNNLNYLVSPRAIQL
jgi:hypothetical protein